MYPTLYCHWTLIFFFLGLTRGSSDLKPDPSLVPVRDKSTEKSLINRKYGGP